MGRIRKGLLDADGIRLQCPTANHDMSAESGNRVIAYRQGKQYVRCRECLSRASAAANRQRHLPKRRPYAPPKHRVITILDERPALWIELRAQLDRVAPPPGASSSRSKPRYMARH